MRLLLIVMDLQLIVERFTRPTDHDLDQPLIVHRSSIDPVYVVMTCFVQDLCTKTDQNVFFWSVSSGLF